MIKKLGMLIDNISNVFFTISNYLLGLAWIVVFIDVVLRNLFNKPQIWIMEVTEYALVYSVFLAAAYSVKSEGFVRIDVIYTKFSQRNRKLADCITFFIGALVYLAIFLFGLQTVLQHFERGTKTISALQLYRFPFLASVPIGSLLLMLQLLMKSFKNGKALMNKTESSLNV